MNLLHSSWRRSLAALTMLGWLSSPGAASPDERPGPQPNWSVAAENSPPEDQGRRQDDKDGPRQDWREDRPDGGPAAEQGKLENELRRIEAELRDVPDQEGERRDNLHRELGKIKEQLEDIRHQAGAQPREDGPPSFWAEWRDRLSGLFSRRQELEEQGKAIRREMEEMFGRQENERAEDVRRKLEEVKRELEAVTRSAQEMAEQKKREIQEQIEQLRQSGQHDAAEKIMQQANKWMEEIKRMGGVPCEPPMEQLPDDLERRIQHLKVAIDNLHAAGFHEPADRLRSDVDRMIREHRERAERQDGRPRGDGPPQGPPQHDGPQGSGPQQGPPPQQGPRGDGPPQGPPQHDGPQGSGPQQGPPPQQGPRGDGPPQGPPQHDGPQGFGPQQGPPPQQGPRGDGPPQGPPRHNGPQGFGPQQGPPPHGGPPQGPMPQGDLNAMIEQLRAEQRQMRDDMQELRELLKNLMNRERREQPEGDRRGN